ncbi:MAG: hypothetical protein C0594_10455 [Marinilabiliales bacterium]|nr:MAG: hypothetical protein C0594_10455 [Marinilabiliales bacterium]
MNKKFQAYSNNVEVNGNTVLSVVSAMEGFEVYALEILRKNGIENLCSDLWYPQQYWLNAFTEIANRIGEKTLYNIGMKIPDNAIFPDSFGGLEEALESINIAYHMNHRYKDGMLLYNEKSGECGKGIGHYHLLSFHPEGKALMECRNPYPSSFDRGIITSVVRRFQGLEKMIKVYLHPEKKNRTNGGEFCHFVVEW